MDERSALTPAGEGDDPSGPRGSRAIRDYAAPEFCRYCGAKLNPLFYFCLGCATPFKPVAAVIPPHRPRKLTGEELVNLKAPRVWPLTFVYATVILGTGMLTWALFQDDRPELRLYLADAIFFVTTCVIAAIYWRSLAVQLRQLGFLRWEAFAGLALLAPILAINWAYHGMLDWLLEAGGFDFGSDYWQDLRDSGVSEAMIVFAFCLLPAVTEEIGFRGLIQHWLQVAIKPWHAILVASALFAAVHFAILSFPYLLLVGMLLGWVKWRTGSLYPCMLIHFLHNLIVIELF